MPPGICPTDSSSVSPTVPSDGGGETGRSPRPVYLTGATGPDLTAISSRFAPKDILESIIEPSKVVSEQYQNIVVTTTTGKTVTGRLLEDSADKMVIQPNPLAKGRYVVINSGHTFREKELAKINYLLFPRLGDWAVMKVGENSVVDAGLFDEQWK